jgi:hypothetical protein
MRSRDTLSVSTSLYSDYDRVPQSSYRRQTLRDARHRMELIAAVMIVLAALLAGWSAYQAKLWHAKAITAFSESSDQLVDALRVDIDVDRELLELQHWHRARQTGDLREAQAIENRFGGEFKAAFDEWQRQKAGDHSPLVLPPELTTTRMIASSRAAMASAQTSNDTANRYILAAGVFVLALICSAGSLRRIDATTQMTALLAAEIFTLLGFAALGMLPAAVGI